MSKSESKAKGDCLVWTGRFAIENCNKPAKSIIAPNGFAFKGEPLIVHGIFKILNSEKTICHAFIQDDVFVYEKIGKKNAYTTIGKESYYSEEKAFNLFGNRVQTKIIGWKTHTLKELFDLMVAAGHKFQKFGIETDY